VPSVQPAQPPKMQDATRGSQRLLEEQTPQTPGTRAFHIDDAAIATHGPDDKKAKLDKRSLDYILRSGLAGGLAGCAVGRTTTVTMLALTSSRQKRSSVPWTASRSSSKLRIPSSQSIPEAGLEL
jgi:hypothetical protein